eukprot:8894454-Heterocapsa_arctica.AAC.1
MGILPQQTCRMTEETQYVGTHTVETKVLELKIQWEKGGYTGTPKAMMEMKISASETVTQVINTKGVASRKIEGHILVTWKAGKKSRTGKSLILPELLSGPLNIKVNKLRLMKSLVLIIRLLTVAIWLENALECTVVRQIASVEQALAQ